MVAVALRATVPSRIFNQRSAPIYWCGWQIEVLFKLDSEALNFGAMLSAKSGDARFRNDNTVLREQILNLRESDIFGSQHEHRCAMSFQ